MKSNIGFLCLGAPKSGTTTLHDLLIQHPEVYLPEEKDFHYFDEDEVYANGLDWYLKYFENQKNELIAGDVAANYLYADPKRVYDDLGAKVKFIVIMRNPADRAYSYYLHFKRRLALEGTFEECTNSDYVEPGSKVKYPYEPIVQWSRYDQYIKKYYDYYDKRQFLFLTFETFVKKQKETLLQVENFLGVSQFSSYKYTSSNQAFSPKSKGVNVLLYKENPIKKILKWVLPSFKLRHQLKQLVIRWNSKKAKKEEFRLSPRLKQGLMENEFKGSIGELRELTGLDFHEWD